jgi:hypothetical protein
MNRIVVLLFVIAFAGGPSDVISCQEAPRAGYPSVSLVLDASYGGAAATFHVALGDLDGDGDLDAVFSNMDVASEVWMNDGLGRFTNSGQFLGGYAHGVGIGDLDGDGDPDLLFAQATSSYSSRVYLNDGTGRFSASRYTLDDRTESANFLSLFDADGDGDLDAGVYYANRTNVLYLNNGMAQFEAFGPRIPGMACWGDVDGDGDVDAVVQRFEGGYSIRLNHGDGTFEEAGIVNAPTTFSPGSFAVGDVDADGDLDIICACGGPTPDMPLTMLRNNGAGGFSYVPESHLMTSLARVSLGDLNGDGSLDVFLGCIESPNIIGLGNGSGGFIDMGTRLGGNTMEGVSGIGDLDGDGDLDLFVAIYGQGGPNEVWLNTTGK